MNSITPRLDPRPDAPSVNWRLGLITLTALASLALGGSAVAGVGALASLKGFAPLLIGGGGLVSGVSFPLWCPSQREPHEKALVLTREYTHDQLPKDYAAQIKAYQLGNLEPGYLEMHLFINNKIVRIMALKRKESDPWRFVLDPSEADLANIHALGLQNRHTDHILSETRGFFGVEDADLAS